MNYVFKYSPADKRDPRPVLHLVAFPTDTGGTTKCRSFESEKDLFAFLLLFPSLRVERISPVYLSDQDAADLGFADC
jgi:hypothetical protein